jgi:hypothetical protein
MSFFRRHRRFSKMRRRTYEYEYVVVVFKVGNQNFESDAKARVRILALARREVENIKSRMKATHYARVSSLGSGLQRATEECFIRTRRSIYPKCRKNHEKVGNSEGETLN